jgi:hypothetical protein
LTKHTFHHNYFFNSTIQGIEFKNITQQLIKTS